jgi:hypothetical protein
MISNWKAVVQHPESHPYYGEYKTRCSDAGLSTAFAARSWDLIIKGLDCEDVKWKTGKLNEVNPHLRLFSDLVEQDAHKLMTPRLLSPGARLALWSGGIEVSQYVRTKGYETLESTVYGHVLDEMTNPVYKIWLGDDRWGPQGSVWNTISAQYVKVTAHLRDTMHVFMRTHDLDSVFYREELTNWQKAKGKSPDEPDGLTYHILIGMDSFKEEKVFVSEREAKRYLLSFLVQVEEKYHKNMLKQGGNFRFKSEVWRDNQRAYGNSFKNKDYADYRAYVESPLPDVVAGFLETDAQMQPSFDTDQFGKVMAELRKKRGPTR